MPRIARVVAPCMPHHITQRGNRRQKTFFSEMDYRKYLELMSESCSPHGVHIWAYCLMPNHVHLIAVPENEVGLRKAIGEAHRLYTRYINFREKWRGYLWQGRFSSFPMDMHYLLAAVRYVELNPVRAGMVKNPGEYLWSSADAHLKKQDDILVETKPLLDMIPDCESFLGESVTKDDLEILRQHYRTGRALGSETFI